MSGPTEAAQSEPETDGAVDPRGPAGAAGPSSAAAVSPTAAQRADRRAKTIETTALNLFYGDFHAVEDVTMTIEPNKVTALIGSSGCGKTTFLRSLNRMHELTAGRRVRGRDHARRRGHLRQRDRPGRGPQAGRDGLPDAESVPDDVDLRERRRRAHASTRAG